MTEEKKTKWCYSVNEENFYGIGQSTKHTYTKEAA